jgi:hypothetical protein
MLKTLLSFLVVAIFTIQSNVSTAQSDIEATVTDGQLLLENQNVFDKSIVIRPTASANKFLIEGLDGTTINGLAQRSFSDVRSIKVDLGAGDDRILVTNRVSNGKIRDFTLAGSLRINPRLGRNVIAVERADIGGSLFLNLTRNGVDYVHVAKCNLMGDFICQDAWVVHVKNSTMDNAFVRGFNTSLFGNVFAAGAITVESGQGADLIGFRDCTSLVASRAWGQVGDDGLWLRNSNLEALHTKGIEFESNAMEIMARIESFSLHADLDDLLLER